MTIDIPHASIDLRGRSLKSVGRGDCATQGSRHRAGRVRLAVSLVLAAGLACIASTAEAQGTGDAAAGQKVFAKCRSCHQVGETARNGVGPQLNGIVGRASASVADYRYSAAMQKAGLVWDAPTLQAFLQKPQAKVPGTKMTIAGVTKDTDFANLLAYLQQFGADGTKAP